MGIYQVNVHGTLWVIRQWLYLHQRSPESCISQGHTAGCPRNLNEALKAWGIPGEPLASSLLGSMKNLGSALSEEMKQQCDQCSLQWNVKAMRKERSFPLRAPSVWAAHPQFGWIFPHQITWSKNLFTSAYFSVSSDLVKLTVRISCHWSRRQNVWLNLTCPPKGPVCKPRLSANRALRDQLDHESSDSTVGSSHWRNYNLRALSVWDLGCCAEREEVGHLGGAFEGHKLVFHKQNWAAHRFRNHQGINTMRYFNIIWLFSETTIIFLISIVLKSLFQRHNT